MSHCNCGCPNCAAKSSELWNELGSELFPEREEISRARRPSRTPTGRSADFGRPATGSAAPGEGCQQPLILDGFAHGDYRLDPTHLAALHEFTLRLRDNPPQPGSVVRIRGHTDPTGSVGANNALGFARALEVHAFLAAALAKIRIAARLSTSSPGANEPVASNSTEPGRKRNRRVEIRVCQGASATNSSNAVPAASEPSTPVEGGGGGGGSSSPPTSRPWPPGRRPPRPPWPLRRPAPRVPRRRR